MKEFARKSDTQFNDLKKALQDGQCHVFRNRLLPASCTRPTASIAMEKDDLVYTLMIDRGIRYKKFSFNPMTLQFKQLLLDGELLFFDFNDLKQFLKGMSSLG